MTARIIKDIRYYESNSPNIEGNWPANLGKIFQPTNDTNYIGQRIARKLNEFQFSYGEYDHIYINLTTALKENEIVISDKNIDKRIKYIDFGLASTNYNSLSEFKKDQLLKLITFKVLRHISLEDAENMKRVEQVEHLLEKFNTEIKIHYKIKESRDYTIEISYQINPINSSTRAIVEYWDKKENLRSKAFIPLHFYEDIYSLIDTITLQDNLLVFKPKKSFKADIHNERYSTPIKISLSALSRH